MAGNIELHYNPPKVGKKTLGWRIISGYITAIAGHSVKNRSWRKPFQLSLSYRDCGGKFCDHSGASDCSAVTVVTISAACISHSPRVGSLSMIRPHKVGQLTHNPESVCLKFAAGRAKYCEPNQCAGMNPTFTLTPVPMFKRDACGSFCHTYIINRIADKIEHTGGNLCRFGILKKFCYLYVTIDWWQSIPDATRSSLYAGLGTMFPEWMPCRTFKR